MTSIQKCNSKPLYVISRKALVMIMIFAFIITNLPMVAAQAADKDNDKEIVFVDSEIKDAKGFVDGITKDVEVIYLDSESDGLEQIANVMEVHSDITAVHIISHGEPGELFLGNSMISSNNIDRYSSLLQRIGSSMRKGGDLLIYGCDITKTLGGVSLVKRIAGLAGVDVAASNNATGTRRYGGDWKLETHIGNINTKPIVSLGYKELLGTITLQNNSNEILEDGVVDTVVFPVDGTKATTLVNSGTMYADTLSLSPVPVISGFNADEDKIDLSHTALTMAPSFNLDFFDCQTTDVYGTDQFYTVYGSGALYNKQFSISGNTLSANGTNKGYLVGYTDESWNPVIAFFCNVTGTITESNFILPGAAIAPTVTGIITNGGPVAGGTSVTITGTDFTGATTVTIGGAAATGVTVVNSTTITATTPAGTAGAKDVVVTTPNGTGTGTGLFTYYNIPTVTSINPNGGPLAGGTSVTITGTNFISGATGVTIGGVAATGVSVVNATTITATTPAGSAGAKDVVVTTPGGTGTGTGLFTYYAVPTVGSINPTDGPTTGGSSITITGTNFTGATGVKIGGIAATGVSVVNSTTITATTPASSAGAKDVAVTTPGGTGTGTGMFTYIAAPTITSISTSGGPVAGGTSVTITGTDFTGATAVTIGGVAATGITVVDSTTITATTPAGTDGAKDVVVTTPNGTGTGTGLFTYYNIPTVTSINPSGGPLVGGTSVTITGTNFIGATGVTIGGVAATGVSVVNSTTITATTPAGSAGAKNVAVTTPGGTGTGTGLFTYYVAPTVDSINPTDGPTTGGTSVTITGMNFIGTTGVTIGGVAATGVSVVNATTITATTQASSAGVKDVTVTTPGGTGTGTGMFTYIAAPTVTNVSPTGGPIAGGTSIIITGTDFTGATAVAIGGVAATEVVVVNSTTITATTPAGTSGVKNVTVTTPNGTGTGNSLFSYYDIPTVTSINPNGGPLAGGTSVTITGTNFIGATGVTIGGVAATGVSVVNSTTITATTPAGTEGAKDVTVTTPGGTGTGVGLFTYYATPTVTGVISFGGPIAGSTSITITGTNFIGATGVTIGGAAATGVTVVNSTTITATTPAGTAGVKDVTVTTPGGTGTGTGLYTYFMAPTITAISPGGGPVAGGTSITIGGTNFTGATGVTIGGEAATGVTVVSPTMITAYSPAGTAGAKDVSVTTLGGTATLSGLYTYYDIPNVSGISPAGGPTSGNTNITITGTNFTDASGVMIGGVAATGVTVVNSTTITATTPAGTAGAKNVAITTPGGTGTGSNLFTYYALPTVTNISLAGASTTGGTNITINGTNFIGATGVTIGGSAATGVTVVNSTTITATTPAGTAGVKDVTVTTPGGTGTGTGLFTYIANTAPTFLGGANNGLTIDEDSAEITITTAMLEVKDAEQNASNITYTIITAPTKGTLKNGSTTLGASSTFTQSDINAGHIKYLPAGNNNGSDSLIFTVSDGDGGNISNTTFSITITQVNDAPSGTPSIAGTPVEGNTITASATGISDVDGLGSLNFQWQVSADGSTGWANITGANSSSYVLKSDEVNKYIRVRVSYTDNDGNPESLNSSAVRISALNHAAQPIITSQPSSKRVKTGDSGILKVEASGVALTYQWYKNTVNSTVGGSIISGANNATYSASTSTIGTMYYYCIITNTDNSVTGTKTNSITSNIAKLDVEAGYSVTYNLNGGSGTAPTDSNLYLSGTSVTLQGGTGLSRSDYTFAGWSVVQNGSIISGSNYIIGASNVTLYAVWNSNPSPAPAVVPVVKPTETIRQVEIKGTNQTSSNSVASVDIVREETKDKKIDSVVLDSSKTTEVLQKVVEQKQDTVQIVVDDVPDNHSDEVKITINKDSVQKLSDSKISLEVKTEEVTIKVPDNSLQTISDNKNDLYFRVVPIKDQELKKEVIQNAITANVVMTEAGGSEVSALGTPMTIETNYQNITTKVVFSLKNINIPKDEEAKNTFLASLGVYINHSDGEQELNRGTIKYDEAGNPIGIEIEIKKFSTFTIVSIENTAPSASKLKISGKAAVGGKLTVSYNYSDNDKDEQGTSIIKWYIADDKTGLNKLLISKGTKTYKVKEKDQGKYLIVKVTPVAKSGEPTGKTVTTYIKVAITKKAVTSTKNSVKPTVQKYNCFVKLGLIKSKSYAYELSKLLSKNYQPVKVVTKKEKGYYRIYIDFTDKASAKKACTDMIEKNLIINYYYYSK